MREPKATESGKTWISQAEDIKKSWQEYKKNHTKKIFMTQIITKTPMVTLRSRIPVEKKCYQSFSGRRVRPLKGAREQKTRVKNSESTAHRNPQCTGRQKVFLSWLFEREEKQNRMDHHPVFGFYPQYGLNVQD
ncbi:hypothetical protein CapIbe_008375 [Capra ibex]